MERPHATRDRISADAARRSAAEHANRAAYLDRRAAAARRRAGLTAVLLLAVAGGWSVVGVVGASVLLGAVPTVLLGGVLLLGRRAVVAGARADAAWAAGAADRVPLPTGHRTRGSGVVGRAVHPSDASTEVFVRVPALPATGAGSVKSGATGATDDRVGVTARTTVERATDQEDVEAPAEVDGSDGGEIAEGSRATGPATADDSWSGSTWAPVPVPPPAYTLKPSARRAEPAPLVLDESHRSEARADVGSDRSAVGPATADRTAQADAAPASGPRTSAEAGPSSTDQGRVEGAPTTGGMSLDAILARRRASGE